MYKNTNWNVDEWVESIMKDVDRRELVVKEDRYYEDFDMYDSSYMDRYQKSRESDLEMY